MRRKVLLGKVTKKSEFSSMVSKKKAAELSALSGVALVGASSSKAFAMEEDDFESNFIREASKNIVDGEEVFSSEALSDEKVNSKTLLFSSLFLLCLEIILVAR